MNTKKLICILSTLLLLSVAVLPSLASESKNQTAVTVTLQFGISGCDDVTPTHTLTVASDIAERYGFETADSDHNGVPVTGVTVFDAIVAEHERVYGDAFRTEPKNYLVMSDGYITKAFGKKAASSGFTVNGVIPNDGIYNPDFYGYTCYACDTAPVTDGDTVSFFFYRDLHYYSDVFCLFDSDAYTSVENQPITVHLQGYSVMYYGINDLQTILENYALPLAGIDIYTVKNGENVLLGTTDENGDAQIILSDSGEYVIFAKGTTNDKSPVIENFATVSVTKKTDEPQKEMNLFAWIQYIFTVIINWFTGLFR